MYSGIELCSLPLLNNPAPCLAGLLRGPSVPKSGGIGMQLKIHSRIRNAVPCESVGWVLWRRVLPDLHLVLHQMHDSWQPSSAKDLAGLPDSIMAVSHCCMHLAIMAQCMPVHVCQLTFSHPVVVSGEQNLGRQDNCETACQEGWRGVSRVRPGSGHMSEHSP